MDYQKYDTPTETRSWDTSGRETYRDYLTLERRAERLKPTNREMQAIRRTVVALTTQGLSVRPVRFLNRVYGTGGKETLSQPESQRCTRGLKLAYAIYREVEDQIDTGLLDTESVVCPVCGSKVTAHIGQLPTYSPYRDEELDFLGDPCVVALDRECDCPYSISDFAKIERESTATEQFVDAGV